MVDTEVSMHCNLIADFYMNNKHAAKMGSGSEVCTILFHYNKSIFIIILVSKYNAMFCILAVSIFLKFLYITFFNKSIIISLSFHNLR